MSVERRERRRCDICGELITGEYYSCNRKTIIDCPAPPVYPGYWQTLGGTQLSNDTTLTLYQPVSPLGIDVDVCPDCWDKMEEERSHVRS